jgi:hypothetical protein
VTVPIVPKVCADPARVAGQCFRMVSSSMHGSPILCPNPVEFRGRFQDGTGKWHKVSSCIEHAGDLSDWKRVSASLTDIADGPKSPNSPDP